MVNVEGLQGEEQFQTRGQGGVSRARSLPRTRSGPMRDGDPREHTTAKSAAAKMLAAADAVERKIEKPRSGSRMAALKHFIIRTKPRDEKLLTDGRVVRVRSDESDVRGPSEHQRQEPAKKERRVSFARKSRSKFQADPVPPPSSRVRVKLD